MKRCLVFCAFVACVLVSVACSNPERQAYLALGDSYATSEGASSASATGYVPLFEAFLESGLGKQLSLRDLAENGETSATMIGKGQLARALAELEFRNQDSDPTNNVLVITLDIGGNDLRNLMLTGQPCAPPARVADAACLTAVAQTIDEVSQNLTAILRALRVAAGPDVRILVLDCSNPYSGTGQPLEAAEDAVLPILNGKIKDIAATPGINAQIVETFAGFEGKGAELTHVAEPSGD
ncbi:MAG: GDSL-type esterase/lipase family protein, partial [Dehalococcoidia bacterium]